MEVALAEEMRHSSIMRLAKLWPKKKWRKPSALPNSAKVGCSKSLFFSEAQGSRAAFITTYGPKFHEKETKNDGFLKGVEETLLSASKRLNGMLECSPTKMKNVHP